MIAQETLEAARKEVARIKEEITSALAEAAPLARELLCDVLAAVPREEAAQQAAAAAAARGAAEDECDGLRTKLETSQANERRLVDQLQRLEASLGAERLEASALKQQLEDLRSRLQVAEADWRRLAVASRALSDALEVWGGGLSTAGNIALGNLRRALGMVP